MPKVYRSCIIELPCEAVWAVLRDFNAHELWHPAIASSRIERGLPGERVSCIRDFTLEDGSVLREQLLSLSDLEMAYSYCLLDTPIPLFNYVAHSHLAPVTDVDYTYWEWRAQFTTRDGDEARMQALVGDGIFSAGFVAMRAYLGLTG